MIIEVILIVLGILTLTLGIWNLLVGAYIWGTLFIIGGIWSIWLGFIYIKQLKKLKKSAKSQEDELDLTQSIDNSEIVSNKDEDEIIQILKETEFDTEVEPEEIEKAITFTNEVMPTPGIEEDELETLDENTQISTQIDDIDRNVEIIQDIAKNQNSEE